MAAALLQRLLPAAEISSAGLYAEEGAPASRHALLAMDEMGLDISQHRAPPLPPGNGRRRAAAGHDPQPRPRSARHVPRGAGGTLPSATRTCPTHLARAWRPTSALRKSSPKARRPLPAGCGAEQGRGRPHPRTDDWKRICPGGSGRKNALRRLFAGYFGVGKAVFASAFQGHRHPAFRGGAPGGCGRKRPAKAVRGGAGRPCLRLHSGVSSPGIHGRRAGRLRPKNAPRRLFAGARGRPCLRLHFGGHYRPAFMGGAPGGCGRKNALRRLFAGAREGRVCVCISGGIIAQHSGAARRAVAAEKRPAKAVRGGAGRPCLRLHFGSIIAQHSGAARRAVAAEKRPAKVVRGGAGRPCLRLHFGSIIARHSGAARRAAPAEKTPREGCSRGILA